MQSIIEINKDRLTELCKSLNIKKMMVFGSATSDKFTNNSDIDFLISFNDNISFEEYTDNYFKLHYKLREIFKRDIDVVTERTLTNPFFIKSVNKTKQLIYEA